MPTKNTLFVLAVLGPETLRWNYEVVPGVNFHLEFLLTKNIFSVDTSVIGYPQLTFKSVTHQTLDHLLRFYYLVIIKNINLLLVESI